MCDPALSVDDEITRRRILIGAAVATGAALLDACAIEPNWLDVSEHEVPVAGLPSRLNGFRIAQVTDAHLDELGSVESAIIEEVSRREVQLIVLTGDLVDSTDHLGPLRELCAGIRATGARVLATVGNWEHWGEVPIEWLRRVYRDVGAELLLNEVAIVGGVGIAGTDDGTAGEVDMRRIQASRKGDAQVLLTHSPGAIDTIPKDVPRYDLTLAGHTHGGQIRLGSKVVPWLPPGSGRFVAGWYDTDLGRAYVSRGTGTSLLPARFTCRPELPIFRLCQG